PKTLYVNEFQKGKGAFIWKETIDGGTPEQLAEGCGFAFDVAPGGDHLLTLVASGENLGIYQYSLAERKCSVLLPGVVTFGLTPSSDGKSFLYAVPSQRDVTVYRQNWQHGKTVGSPTVALKLPFAFPLVTGGNAYDLTRDLSKVVYVRPGGHAELYYLGEK